jgi:hypothetical protein
MRIAALVCLLLALGAGGVWYKSGKHLATLTKKPVEIVKKDDFGDEVKEIQWEDTFEPGLDICGPAGGGLVGLAAVLLFVDRRKRRARGAAATGRGRTNAA